MREITLIRHGQNVLKPAGLVTAWIAAAMAGEPAMAREPWPERLAAVPQFSVEAPSLAQTSMPEYPGQQQAQPPYRQQIPASQPYLQQQANPWVEQSLQQPTQQHQLRGPDTTQFAPLQAPVQAPQDTQGRESFGAVPGPVMARVPPPTVIPAPAPSSILPSPPQFRESVMVPDNSVLSPAEQGVVAGGVCGSLDDGCPGYRLYTTVDALFLARYSGIEDRPLVFNEDSGKTLLSSRDLQWAYAPGVRAFFGERRPGNCGWEVGYLGLYGMNADSQVFGPADLIAPDDLGANASQFNSADLMSVSYTSMLNMAEANLFWYDCCGGNACQTTCQGRPCQPSCGSCRCIDWLAGFRWAGLNESASFQSTCCGLTETSVYAVDATSNLFGAQVGVRARKDYAHWACEGWMKLGLAGVWMNQWQSPIVDAETLVPYREGSSSTASGLAGFADANASTIYKFNRTWGLRLGVTAIWLGNVALAPDQWDFNQTSSVTTIDPASLILVGGNAGLEARW